MSDAQHPSPERPQLEVFGLAIAHCPLLASCPMHSGQEVRSSMSNLSKRNLERDLKRPWSVNKQTSGLSNANDQSSIDNSAQA
eukprot:5005906-Amphidinium_carterae.2